MTKLSLCCAKSEELAGGLLNEMRKQLTEYRERLRKLRSRRDMYGINEYKEVRWGYSCLLEKQEVYWRQRAKQFWLTEGDQNSRFFFIRMHRKGNIIMR